MNLKNLKARDLGVGGTNTHNKYKKNILYPISWPGLMNNKVATKYISEINEWINVEFSLIISTGYHNTFFCFNYHSVIFHIAHLHHFPQWSCWPRWRKPRPGRCRLPSWPQTAEWGSSPVRSDQSSTTSWSPCFSTHESSSGGPPRPPNAVFSDIYPMFINAALFWTL